ncbi:hypothetical protein DFH09DRAFT_1075957 [Mycena vulgaris]|nr:hypothetical protein DFH09DRAFT_1075957 [Mycena vulgaris]
MSAKTFRTQRDGHDAFDGFFGEANLPLRMAAPSRKTFLSGGMRGNVEGLALEDFHGTAAKETLQRARKRRASSVTPDHKLTEVTTFHNFPLKSRRSPSLSELKRSNEVTKVGTTLHFPRIHVHKIAIPLSGTGFDEATNELGSAIRKSWTQLSKSLGSRFVNEGLTEAMIEEQTEELYSKDCKATMDIYSC